MKKVFYLLLIMLFALANCRNHANLPPKENMMTQTRPKVSEPKVSTVEPNKKYFATISTEKGDIKVELYAEDAPFSVTNFIQLAKAGYYDELTFHRVEPGFVVQGGDP